MISKYIDKFIVKIHINNVFYLIFINLRKLNFRPQNIYFKYFNICIKQFQLCQIISSWWFNSQFY